MVKAVVAVVAALAVWIAIVTVAGLIMRLSWSAYASVAAAMTFTLPMLIARLSISAVATVAMGCVAAFLAPRSTPVQLMPGVILLLGFIPQHISLWNVFPVWYHLVFLLTLVPLTYMGSRLSPRAR